MKMKIMVNQAQINRDLNRAKMLSPNLKILISNDGDLWHGQAQNGVNFYFQVQFDLEDDRQSAHKTTGISNNVFYISDRNLVILAWTVDELSHGRAHDWRTHTHTRRQRQYPKAKTGLGWKLKHTHVFIWYTVVQYLTKSSANTCITDFEHILKRYI